MNAPELVTASEAARRLGVPLSLLLRGIESGKVPATRGGTFKNSPFLLEAATVEQLRKQTPDIKPHAQS